MTVLHEFHLIVLALVSFAKLEPDKQNQTPFRFVENSSEGIAGNVLPIVHTALRLHSIRRLKKRPTNLPEPRPARQGGR
ncbi:MAG: hypothetical protein QOJ84_5143 [Bradyrhizobium sp.]|jgi:hypothetical protein|nr:hypothetical protein [Bradyrhizobium sp.]